MDGEDDPTVEEGAEADIVSEGAKVESNGGDARSEVDVVLEAAASAGGDELLISDLDIEEDVAVVPSVVDGTRNDVSGVFVLVVGAAGGSGALEDGGEATDEDGLSVIDGVGSVGGGGVSEVDETGGGGGGGGFDVIAVVRGGGVVTVVVNIGGDGKTDPGSYPSTNGKPSEPFARR